MSSGNAHQSKWSQEFHASRGNTSLPCPTEGLANAGHAGSCKEAHPRGIAVTASDRWYARPAFDPGDMPQVVEHYV